VSQYFGVLFLLPHLALIFTAIPNKRKEIEAARLQ
jgi:hypothetical protein